MKKLVIVLISIISINTYAQTTETEYNYLTKGYKIQLESGLDMKKGYYFKDIEEWGLDYSSFQRNVEFKQLFRENENIPCATLMIFKRTDTKYVDYICIPHYDSSSELWERARLDFFKSADSWSSAGKAYAWSMNKMISYLSSQK